MTSLWRGQVSVDCPRSTCFLIRSIWCSSWSFLLTDLAISWGGSSLSLAALLLDLAGPCPALRFLPSAVSVSGAEFPGNVGMLWKLFKPLKPINWWRELRAYQILEVQGASDDIWAYAYHSVSNSTSWVPYGQNQKYGFLGEENRPWHLGELQPGLCLELPST